MANISNKYYSSYKSSQKIGNITFWNLHFSPHRLSEIDYLLLKDELLNNTNLNPYPKNDFWIFYRQELIYFSVCLTLLILNKFISASWFNFITILLNIFGAYVLILFIADVKEYSEYADKRNMYLKYLKEDVLNSLNYNEFVSKQKEKPPFLYK